MGGGGQIDERQAQFGFLLVVVGLGYVWIKFILLKLKTKNTVAK